MADDLKELTGGLRRMWSTASLSSKLGLKAAGRIFLSKKDKDVDPEEALASSEAAVATAKKLVAKMGKLKGLAMKAGQIASYMPGALPPAAQEVLAELQASSTPMSYARIDEVLAAELGQSGRDLFDTIDERPFAAASIGQVHRATFEGAPVAVKVQYPGVEDAIRNDLRMVAIIARLSSVGTPLDGGALSAELRDRLLEECDYLREADSQRLFATLLSTVDGARVPTVIAARSSRRVLTSGFADGTPIAALTEQSVRDRAGQVIFRACFELLFRRCIYNADPHPGNYLVDADGNVTFLDFGCVRRFDPAMIRVWKKMALSIIDDNREGFETGFRALGFVGKEKKFDWDYQWNAMRTLYRPFIEPDYRYNPTDVTKSFGELMFDNPNRMRIALPPAWLFLNRLQWGLNAVLAQLGAAGPWGTTIRELLTVELDPA